MTTPKTTTTPRKTMPDLPAEKDLIAFGHSAAGHEGISSNASGSLIIKPCMQAEIDFYASAANHPLFQAHMPTYIGCLTLNQDQDAVAPVLSAEAIQEPEPKQQHAKRTSWVPSGGAKLSTNLAIVLENVAAGFTHPNVLDVKLGARLWDNDAPVAKRKKLDDVAATTTSGSLGFRVAGMKLWGEEGEKNANMEVKDGYRSYDKHYGRTFDKETVKEAFVTYFGGLGEDGKLRQRTVTVVASRLLRELRSMQYALEQEESRMYSASILMVYEGDEAALAAALQTEKEETANEEFEEDDDDDDDEEDDDEEEEEVKPKVYDARLIDFAHGKWTPRLGPDENMLQGVRSVVAILEGLVAQ